MLFHPRTIASAIWLALTTYLSLLSTVQSQVLYPEEPEYSSYITLAYPPLAQSGYIYRHGALEPGFNQSEYFNCPLPGPDQLRVPWPTISGRIGLDFTNETGGLPGQSYSAETVIGQIEAPPDVNITTNSTGGPQTGYASADGESWANFTTGRNCSTRFINATEVVTRALWAPVWIGTDNQDPNGHWEFLPSYREILGWNATFLIKFRLGDENGGLVEESYQCGYVTFVSPLQFTQLVGNYCPGGDQVHTDFATAGIVAPSATAASTLTSVPSPSSSSSRNETHLRNIGAAVGASLGTALFLLLIGGILLYRRRRLAREKEKQQQQPETLANLQAAGEHPPPYVEVMNEGEKLGEKQEGLRKELEDLGKNEGKEELPVAGPSKAY